MKFLDINLITSLSHSRGYIRTEKACPSWPSFVGLISLWIYDIGNNIRFHCYRDLTQYSLKGQTLYTHLSKVNYDDLFMMLFADKKVYIYVYEHHTQKRIKFTIDNFHCGLDGGMDLKDSSSGCKFEFNMV